MNTSNLSQLHNIVFTVGRITPSGVSLLGTCFLLNESGLLATAAHVTSNDEQNLVIVFSQGTDIMSYQDTSNNSVNAIPARIYAVDAVRDICILKVDQDVKSNLRIIGSDQASIAQHLDIIGYPHCTEGRRVLTYQSTVVGAKVLIESANIKSKHLILNIQTKPGQSGSPIFDSETGVVVAMLIGSYAPTSKGFMMIGDINPHTLHQTTHAISSEYLIEMI
ncbi:S1 family peptidase [Pedobacter roseus]|uniref:Trypsin-like peptidase domain-containing protein n=1 Tax=Pedobacter roseus TaxID=336820 RepID=A0A7G9Q9Z7_9SPHI|nr:serine protease [Pedobacter roseus]QNN40172.1 trypsin-like peptidase domain-containing protein [Pedobacter roseus]